MASIETDQTEKTGTEEDHKAGKRQDKEGFFNILRSATSSEWERRLLYMYRLEPRRPNSRSNPNILCIQEPIYEDTVKQRYGSGVYQFRLNEKKGTKYSEIANVVIEIEDPNFPPVMPGVDGWESDPANKRWAWAKKDEAKVNGQATLDRQGETTAIKELAAVTQQLLARGSAMSETERKILMDANAAAIDIVKERSKGEGKGNDIGSLVSALVQLQALIKPAPATDPLALMTQLVGLVKEIVPKTPPPAATGATGLSGITEFAQAVTAMREAFGPEATGAAANPAPAAAESTWEKLGNMFVNLLAPAMPPLGNAIGHLILTKTAQPGQPAIRPNLTPATESAGVPAIPEPTGEQALTQEQTMMIVVAQKIAAAFEMNVTGDSFAEVFEQQQGSLAYDAVVSVPAEERIKQLQAVPQAWAILQRFEKALPEFMAAFYEYGKGEPPEGTEPVPIDEGPAKRTRGKK